MASHGHPAVDTCVDVTGLANPSPMHADIAHSENGRLSHLQDLVSRVPLRIALRGFADEGISTPICPQVRRSPLSEESVQHLDLVSCWKGLSPLHVVELTTWTRLFRECLGDLIKAWLQRDMVEQLSRYPGSTNETLLIPRIVHLLSRDQPLMVKVSMADLVHEMISSLYNTTRTDTLHSKFEWSLSSGNLPDFVFNVIHTQDCFHHTRDGSFVRVDLSYSYTVGDLTAFAGLHWRLPRVTFSVHPMRPVKGQMFYISPYFVDTSSKAAVYSGFSARKDDITYSVTRSPLLFQWDSTHQWFHAPVLDGFAVDGKVQETILYAKITTSFQDDVRFERVSRYNIKLGLDTEPSDDFPERFLAYARRASIPEYPQDCSDEGLYPRLQDLSGSSYNAAPSSLHDHSSTWIPSYTNTPLSKTRRSTPLVSQLPRSDHNVATNDAVDSENTGVDQAGHRNLQHQALHAFTNNQTPVDLEGSSASSENMKSPGKRKSWSSSGLFIDAAEPLALVNGHRPNLEVDTKRRKLWQNVDSDVLMSSDSDPLSRDEAENDARSAVLVRAVNGFKGRSDTPSSPGTRQISFTWLLPQSSLDHSPASSEDSSPAHDIEPPVTASTTTSASTDALQEQIQHNYQEFEERQKQQAAEREYYKAAIPGFDGIVSPTDVEKRFFEGIFMEDDEVDDWSSDDGLSQRTGSICQGE